MLQLLGEYECRLDPKGRLMLPAGLRKQLPPDSEDRMVINRGFEKCLVLYPYEEWLRESAVVNSLNQYRKDVRDFVRHFSRGATDLVPDTTGRVLLPKPLLDYAGIDKDLVLAAFGKRIEVWSQDAYNALLNSSPDDFADLAEKVMGTQFAAVNSEPVTAANSQRTVGSDPQTAEGNVS